MEGNLHAWNMLCTIQIQFQRKKFLFTENGNIMPELFQILKYARSYAKEQFFMKIMLKA